MGIEELIKEIVKEEGKKESVAQNTREITIKSLQNGMDINLISNITGLSIKEIKKIEKEGFSK